jgi:hypothetical protein
MSMATGRVDLAGLQTSPELGVLVGAATVDVLPTVAANIGASVVDSSGSSGCRLVRTDEARN